MKTIISFILSIFLSLAILPPVYALTAREKQAWEAFKERNRKEKIPVTDSKSAFEYMENPQIKGNKILFYASASDGTFDIFTMNKDGSELRNLTSELDRDEMGAYWTSDGGIVFDSSIFLGPAGRGRSLMMDENGNNVRTITFDEFNTLKTENPFTR